MATDFTMNVSQPAMAQRHLDVLSTSLAPFGLWPASFGEGLEAENLERYQCLAKLLVSCHG